MTITIAGTKFEKYNQCNVHLTYDSVASTFSFLLYFDPTNKAQRDALRPGRFPDVTIEHNGTLLLTGTLLSYRFRSSASKKLVAVSGYSKTGVLEDCQIPTDKMPLQNTLTLNELAVKIADVYGLKVQVDNLVLEACNQTLPGVNANSTETAKSFLADMAGQANVILSHTTDGKLLLTGYKTKTSKATFTLASDKKTVLPTFTQADKAPVYNFTNGMPGVEYDLIFDGQRMHSDISVTGQASVTDSNNAIAATPLQNIYVDRHYDYMGNAYLNTIGNPNQAPLRGYRPRVSTQTVGTYLTTEKAQRNVLSEELKAIPLTIQMHGWSVGGKTIVPGDIITVTNPELHIYNAARFFVSSVEYKAPDTVKEVAILHCVVPEAYNNDNPTNIFL